MTLPSNTTTMKPVRRPSSRTLKAAIPLQRNDGSRFSLAESSRRVQYRRIQAEWLVPRTVELNETEIAILNRLSTGVHDWDVTDTRLHYVSPGHRDRYQLRMASYFGAQSRSERTLYSTLKKLVRMGVITDVWHHVMERDESNEFVRRIDWFVPTMAAIERVDAFHTDAVSDFWLERIAAGHLYDMRQIKLSKAVSQHVQARDHGTCQSFGRHYRHCRCSYRCQLQLDHITPRALGGTDHAWNLQLLCARCNYKKGATPPRHDDSVLGRLVAGANRYTSAPPRRTSANTRELDAQIAAIDPDFVSTQITCRCRH